MIARIAAPAALVVAIVAVAVLVLSGGSSYSLKLDFQEAGGLVSGDQVMIGPAIVGSVNGVGLTPNGQAQVEVGLSSSAAPMHQGTIARVYENSLSGIANRYVVLEPGPSQAPTIPSGATIGEDHTYSFVSLDQVFDTFDPLTRAGLRNFIRGEAASIQGRSQAARQTLLYFAPALASTSDVTAELARDEPAFDGLLVQGAQAMQALAARSRQLTQLVANADTATGAIASQSQSLVQALALFPGVLTRSTSTFSGLDTTLNPLEALVAASKPAVRRLAPFSAALRRLLAVGIPTVAQLNDLIRNPGSGGDLTKLALLTPSLAKTAETAFPHLIRELNDSQAQLDTLREYTPDLAAALSDLGQAGAYYDANGHYVRTQPVFFSFAVNGLDQLTPQPAFDRFNGIEVVKGRCPGGAVQPTPDGSAPWVVPGCRASSSPVGP